MKTILRNAMLATIFSLTFCVGVAGCAFLDGFVGHDTPVEATFEDGAPAFIGDDGTPTREATKPDGTPRERYKIVLIKPAVEARSSVTNLLGMLGPWGALIGTVIGGGATVYARWRNKQRLEEAGLRADAESELDLATMTAQFVIGLVEKIKVGSADVFTDGKLDNAKLKEWLRAQGKEFTDPAYLAEMVERVTKAM